MAKKGDAEALGLMVGVAIIVAPFVWLYNAVGEFWFWVIVIAVPVLALVGWFLQEFEKAKVAALKPPATPAFALVVASDEGFVDDDSAWRRHCEKIEQAWARGDYDWARQELQRISYSMVGKSVTQDAKDRFTQVMKDFAKEDPLYNEVMARLSPLLQANPGMVQSQIYKGEPDHIKEQMRYVLYFANELGHIQRVKKGNSYKLYPPGMVIDSSAK